MAIELEKLDMVSSQSVDLVEECLKSIGRWDLAKKVAAYKNSGWAKAAVSAPWIVNMHGKPTAPIMHEIVTYIKG